ncbi:TPA: transposase [Salmonella enterica subsp. salamae serovar 28:r:e,n,z15]|nr:transposase [Salmonella enterica subsp. salamae serovar 28:r:e,n,z15]
MVETQVDTEWLAQEIDESSFNDRRLGRRFRELMANFWKNIGSTIPFVCQDWAGTKAAYRFLSNPHVDESYCFRIQRLLFIKEIIQISLGIPEPRRHGEREKINQKARLLIVVF